LYVNEIPEERRSTCLIKNVIENDEAFPCIECGEDTMWYDVTWGHYFCSEECLNSYEKGMDVP